MQKLLECVPNFSEGRNKRKIAKIADSIRKIAGIKILNISSDYDHNRSVITFAGPPESVIKAAFNAAKIATAILDLNKHRGVHPRMGATDVIPLIPIRGITNKEAVKYAKQLAKRLGTELKIPVYLYEKAANKKIHQNLSNIRNYGYENLKKTISSDPGFKPDYGPKKLGQAGATAVGVRNILIAYNVNLKTKNLAIAKKIAKKIRFSSGGLPAIKALGMPLTHRKIVQVSINILNYEKTGIYTVFKAIAKEARKYKCHILESEIVGLVPEKALTACGNNYKKQLKLGKNFTENQILEKALQKIFK